MQKSLMGLFSKPITTKSMSAKLRKYGMYTDQIVLSCWRAAMSDYRVSKTMSDYNGSFFAKQAIIYARNYNYWLWIGFLMRTLEKVFGVDLSSNSSIIMKSKNSLKVKMLLLSLHSSAKWIEKIMENGEHLMPIYPGSDFGIKS